MGGKYIKLINVEGGINYIVNSKPINAEWKNFSKNNKRELHVY